MRWRITVLFTDTYYLANNILFNEQYFQIKINNLQRGSMIPETWNIHTVIVTLKHELFVHSVAALPRLARHCAPLWKKHSLQANMFLCS